jgi:hypothetical protein
MKTIEARRFKRTDILAMSLVCFFTCTGSSAYTDYDVQPAWWVERNVVSTNSGLFINDQAPVNQGQVKWFALQAYEEFNEKLPGATNSNIQQRVASFTDQNNYLPANIGQLKNVVAPCYDRLFEYGLAGSYPWEGKPELSNDYAIATVGELKNLYNFELPVTTNLYYVATDGSDENPGTFELPFQTISHAVKQVVPGDTVLIRGGTYREQVTLTTSGTPELPITIMGYGDEYPTIKGSDVVTNWVHYRDNIWMVTNWTINSQQVFDDGVPLQQIGYPHQIFEDNPTWYNLVGLDVDDMMPGSFFWDADLSRLYVWLPDREAPPVEGLEVSTIIRPFHGGVPACSCTIIQPRSTVLSATMATPESVAIRPPTCSLEAAPSPVTTIDLSIQTGMLAALNWCLMYPPQWSIIQSPRTMVMAFGLTEEPILRVSQSETTGYFTIKMEFSWSSLQTRKYIII